MKRDILCDYPFFVAFLKAHRRKGWSSLFYIKKTRLYNKMAGMRSINKKKCGSDD